MTVEVMEDNDDAEVCRWWVRFEVLELCCGPEVGLWLVAEEAPPDDGLW